MRLVILLASALLCTGVSGVTLLDRNPFIWPGFEAQAQRAPTTTPQASAEDYEFHAVYELSGSTHILIHDRKNNDFQWLSVGEEVDGLNPKSYDPDKNQLLLAYANKELWLSLKDVPEPSGTPVVTAPRQTPTPKTVASNRTPTRTQRRVIRPSTSRRVPPATIRRTPTRTPPSTAAARRSGRTQRSAEEIGLTKPNYVPQGPASNAPPTSAPDFIPNLINPPPIPNP